METSQNIEALTLVHDSKLVLVALHLSLAFSIIKNVVGVELFKSSLCSIEGDVATTVAHAVLTEASLQLCSNRDFITS